MMNDPSEYSFVEVPFIEQLRNMGWSYLSGDLQTPRMTERESFREVLLKDRLRRAIHNVNRDDNDQPWLDEARINAAISGLERLDSKKLLEANQSATNLLLTGTSVEGDAVLHGGKDQTIHYINFTHPERNDFLIINQFRVNIPGSQSYIIPDIVLFVNGIPLVVVECKSPASTDPLQEAITQLLRYANQRNQVTVTEGVERLFFYNQLMIATCFQQARVGTVGSSYEHYQEWKDTSPVPMADVAGDLGVKQLKSQQILIAGMLRPDHLVDIVRNFTLFQQSGGKTIKIIPRYQQFRAVHLAIHRLRHNPTREQHGEHDLRGGIIWHTQGSGKSLTMVFLVRKMRTLRKLRRFKIVVVTDRTDLEKQLSDTAVLTGDNVRRAASTEKLKEYLRQEGADLVFAMIQKYQEREQQADLDEENTTQETSGEEEQLFEELNPSSEILVLIDEAHRSQSSDLHANLLRALPNCARIGFTGTPILMGDRKKTHEIFGSFIDSYTIRQSEQDGSTVPIYYEGRDANPTVIDHKTLDELFEQEFKDQPKAVRERATAKYATKSNVLEGEKLIAAKAEDMLRHYVETILPNGLKAMVIANSRQAAVRYQAALADAHQRLLTGLRSLDVSKLPAMGSMEFEQSDVDTQFLVRAHQHLATIEHLEFATVISGGNNDDPCWRQWSNRNLIDSRIERFRKPLLHNDPTRQDGLAFLCVKSMLITGFDAPVAQVIYLDRFMQGHELLQAIARVNRTYSGKDNGLLVDYCGVAQKLKEALQVYSADDIRGALTSIKDELPVLSERHRRVLAIFKDNGVADINNIDACVDLLHDPAIRQDFSAKLKLFMTSLEIVLPRPEALPFVHDAKVLGFINKSTINLYKDDDLDLVSCGQKIRELIDQYIGSLGVELKVQRVSILQPEFEQAIDTQPTNKAKASYMEHEARFHIREHYQEDPVYYRKLSEHLEEILQQFQENWVEMVEALRAFTQEVRQGPQQDESGLDPYTQVPFLRILREANNHSTKKKGLSELASLTVEMVEHIRQEIHAVDFWRNTDAQNILRQWLVGFLDDNDIAPWKQVSGIADEIISTAKARHARLDI